jgi:hypothetical protein
MIRLMRNIIPSLAILALLCTLAPTLRAAADDNPLAPVEPLLGEWTIDATWAGGQPLKARQTYTRHLNDKFIVARSILPRDDGSGEYVRYETFFAPKDGKLVSYNFSHDGQNDVRPVEVEGKVLRFRSERAVDGGKMTIDQTIELTDNDTIAWKVWIERDGNRTQIMDGQWKRKKD